MGGVWRAGDGRDWLLWGGAAYGYLPCGNSIAVAAPHTWKRRSALAAAPGGAPMRVRSWRLPPLPSVTCETSRPREQDTGAVSVRRSWTGALPRRVPRALHPLSVHASPSGESTGGDRSGSLSSRGESTTTRGGGVRLLGHPTTTLATPFRPVYPGHPTCDMPQMIRTIANELFLSALVCFLLFCSLSKAFQPPPPIPADFHANPPFYPHPSISTRPPPNAMLYALRSVNSPSLVARWHNRSTRKSAMAMPSSSSSLAL